MRLEREPSVHAIGHNDLVRHFKQDKIWFHGDGDKIRWVYLKKSIRIKAVHKGYEDPPEIMKSYKRTWT